MKQAFFLNSNKKFGSWQVRIGTKPTIEKQKYPKDKN
jgi:hypothetical protein